MLGYSTLKRSLGNFRLGTLPWELSRGNPRLVTFADVSLEISRLGTLALDSLLGDFRLISCARNPLLEKNHWGYFAREFSPGNLQTVTLEPSLGNFDFEYLTWNLWLGIRGFGSLAWDLWLGIFGLESLAWVLRLRILDLGSSAPALRLRSLVSDLGLWIFGLGALALALWLWIFDAGSFA